MFRKVFYSEMDGPGIIYNHVLYHAYFLGFHINQNQLGEVAQESDIVKINDDYVPQQFKQNSESIIPYPKRVENAE